MNTPLCDLCRKYGTDKVIWGYTPYYHELLAPMRERVKKVLEIGICGYRDIPNNVVGASLWVWNDYFPNAAIYGVDIDSKFMVHTDRITSFCCDAYTELLPVLDQLGKDIDFVVDDAVHDPENQIALARSIWPHLAVGGIMAIEDVCPYKLLHGNVDVMISQLPGSHWTVVQTHKPEVLLLGVKV